MNTMEWRRVLQMSGFFSSLDETALEHLLEDDASHERSFKEGSVLFTEGEAGDSTFIVGTGRVEVTRRAQNGRSISLAIITPGQMFGEMAALGGGVRSATATALEDITLLEFSGPYFLDLLINNPKVQLQISTLFSQRLRHADEIILNLAVNDVRDEVNQLRAKVEDQSKAIADALQTSRIMFQETKAETDHVLRSGNQQVDNLRFLFKILTIGGPIVLAVVLAAAGWVGYKTWSDVQATINEFKTHVTTATEAIATDQANIHATRTSIDELIPNYYEQSYTLFEWALNTPKQNDEVQWYNTIRSFQEDPAIRLLIQNNKNFPPADTQTTYQRLFEDVKKAMKEHPDQSYVDILQEIVKQLESAKMETNETTVGARYFVLSDLVLFPESRKKWIDKDEEKWMNDYYEETLSSLEKYISKKEDKKNAVCTFLDWREITGERNRRRGEILAEDSEKRGSKEKWEARLKDFKKWEAKWLTWNQSLDCNLQGVLGGHPVSPVQKNCSLPDLQCSEL